MWHKTYFVVFLATLTFSATALANTNPPKVVLILIDDTGWRDVGFAGNTFVETPNIDRLAREGIQFTQAYASAPRPIEKNPAYDPAVGNQRSGGKQKGGQKGGGQKGGREKMQQLQAIHHGKVSLTGLRRHRSVFGQG